MAPAITYQNKYLLKFVFDAGERMITCTDRCGGPLVVPVVLVWGPPLIVVVRHIESSLLAVDRKRRERLVWARQG